MPNLQFFIPRIHWITSINAMKAPYWSAAIDGVIAVPVMVVAMLIVSRADIMGAFAVRGGLRALGWLATVVMAIIVVAMAATSV